MRKKASCLARGEKATPCQRTLKRGSESPEQVQIKTPPHVRQNMHPRQLRTYRPLLCHPSREPPSGISSWVKAPGFLLRFPWGWCVWVLMWTGRKRNSWTAEECVPNKLGFSLLLSVNLNSDFWEGLALCYGLLSEVCKWARVLGHDL